MERNKDVRKYVKENAVCLWEVAEALGMADSALSRKLRRELPDEIKDKIYAIVNQIVAERKGENACS